MVLIPFEPQQRTPFGAPDDREFSFALSRAGSGLLIENARRILRMPSLYAVGKMLGIARASDASTSYYGGKRAMSAYYLGRLFYACMLVLHDPAYWTPSRLQHIDWDTVHQHPRAIPMSAELRERLKGKRRKPVRKAVGQRSDFVRIANSHRALPQEVEA